MKRELLIGCGSERTKRLTPEGVKEWSSLTTLDINEDHNPDFVWDLMSPEVLPLEWSNFFDEIHAYEVLEHLGQQGDYKLFFRQFEAFWRVLKPNGYFCATCPSRLSPWAWGDPSHTRVLQKENLAFLSQDEYARQVGKTAMSDFRYIYQADFLPVFVHEDENNFMFVLRAIK